MSPSEEPIEESVDSTEEGPPEVVSREGITPRRPRREAASRGRKENENLDDYAQ